MNDKITKHPSIRLSQDMNDICSPLKQLNITYFAHACVDNEGNFSAIGNNPKFAEIYLENKYYNADIHLAKSNKFGNFVMWDAIELSGKSHKMHTDANSCGVKHTFTIIEKDQHGSHFFHFANDSDSKVINQGYLANLDLLKQFISHFKQSMNQSKELSEAYNLKYQIEENASGYTIQSDDHIANLQMQRTEFVQSMANNSKLVLPEGTESYILFHKDTSKPVVLAKQQMRCYQLLIEGDSAKEIAAKLDLSIRTVNHYLGHIRKILGCRSSKEMIAVYNTAISLTP